MRSLKNDSSVWEHLGKWDIWYDAGGGVDWYNPYRKQSVKIHKNSLTFHGYIFIFYGLDMSKNSKARMFSTAVLLTINMKSNLHDTPVLKTDYTNYETKEFVAAINDHVYTGI